MKRIIIAATALLSLASGPLLRAGDESYDDHAPVMEISQDGLIKTLRILPTPAQAEEVEILHTLTLTEDQWQIVRLSLPGAPKRIDPVLTAAAAKHSKQRPAALVSDRDGVVTLAGDSVTVICGDYAAALYQEKSLTLTADRRGRFYFRGVLIPFDQLAAATENCPPSKPGEEKTVEILLPPGMTSGDATVHDRLLVLYTTFASHGWNGSKLPAGFTAPALAPGSH